MPPCPTTTSIQVAQFFGKRHDNVLRAIRVVIRETASDNRLLNFEETVDVRENPSGGAPISMPAYRMDREGFMLLAMGFTGKEALRWKLAYIAAFNRMEAELQKPAYDPARIQLAHSLAAQAAAQVTQTVFEAIASGRNSDWRRALHARFCLRQQRPAQLAPRANAGRRANGGVHGRADPAHHQPRCSPLRRAACSPCHRLHPATHPPRPVPRVQGAGCVSAGNPSRFSRTPRNHPRRSRTLHRTAAAMASPCLLALSALCLCD